MMGCKRSVENCLNWEIYVQGFVWFVLIFTARISSGITNPADGKSGAQAYMFFFVLFG